MKKWGVLFVCVLLILVLFNMVGVMGESYRISEFTIPGLTDLLSGDPTTGAKLCDIKGCCAFTSLDTWYATSCSDETISYWDLSSEQWESTADGCLFGGIMAHYVGNFYVRCSDCGHTEGCSTPACDLNTCDSYSLPECFDGDDGCGGSLFCNIKEEAEFSYLVHTECVSQNPVDDLSLVLDYSFDEDFSGGTVNDLSGYGHDGTAVGATYNSIGGHDGMGAVEFGGDDDYINVDSVDFINGLQELTVSLWFKASDIGVPSGSDIIVKQYSENDPYASFNIDFTNDKKARFGIDDDGWKRFTSVALNLDTWYHATMVIRLDKMIGYIDGVEVGSYDRGTLMDYNDEPLILGMFGESGWSSFSSFDGSMDDVKIWDRSLSQVEVEALFDLNRNSELECESGWGNCDDEDWSDGCETDLASDTNCGSCNNNCAVDGKTCIAGSCVSSVYNLWTDMNGGAITSVDLNDYVRLVSNVFSPYDIFRDGFPETIKVDEKYWKANISGDEFGFNSGSGVTEDLINVNDGEENDEMDITVLGPFCGDDFDLNVKKLNVSFIVDDPDDLVTGSVEVDGVEVMLFNNSEENRFEYVADFEGAGSVSVVISATNSRSDPDHFRMVSNIMVYNSSNPEDQYYVASCIDSPENFFKTDSSVINFDARSTRAIKYNNVDGITEFGHEELLFTWKFIYYGRTVPDVCSAMGSEHCDTNSDWNITRFPRVFPTVNDNRAILSVSIPADAM